MKNGKSILERAQQLAASVESWADLSNALFDPVGGLLTRAYPTRAERVRFMKTQEYKAIHRLLAEARATFGLVEGATPKKRSRSKVPT